MPNMTVHIARELVCRMELLHQGWTWSATNKKEWTCFAAIFSRLNHMTCWAGKLEWMMPMEFDEPNHVSTFSTAQARCVNQQKSSWLFDRYIYIYLTIGWFAKHAVSNAFTARVRSTHICSQRQINIRFATKNRAGRIETTTSTTTPNNINNNPQNWRIGSCRLVRRKHGFGSLDALLWWVEGCARLQVVVACHWGM